MVTDNSAYIGKHQLFPPYDVNESVQRAFPSYKKKKMKPLACVYAQRNYFLRLHQGLPTGLETIS